MRRALLIPSFICLALLAAGAPAAPAAAGGEGASPWEHPLWHESTVPMRLYLCNHARRPPSWCAAPQPLPGKTELPAVQGPPLHEEDARWLAFLEKVDPANLSQEDVAMIRHRAVERDDPQAMEILGFLYAEGLGVARDYAEAYRWYGRAYLAGEIRVRANMDVVWELLQRHDLTAAMDLVREFDAQATSPGATGPGATGQGAAGQGLPGLAGADSAESAAR